MKIGILGLPQSGKRTLFTLLTGRSVPPSRRPGETVDGVARVRDERVDVLTGICRPRKTTLAENHFALCPDVAGDGGGRDWLDAARRCDLLCLLVRAFASDQVYHPRGTIDPEHDRATLDAELKLADMELILNRLIRISREKTSGQSAAQAIEETTLRKCEQALEENRCLSEIDLSPEERTAIGSLGLVSLLPWLWTYNVSEAEVGRDFGPGTFTVSCQIEQQIAALEDDEERREFLSAMGLTSTGLDRMNGAAYNTLGLMSFYTIGKDEVRAWTVRKGATAPEAGGKIHSDIRRGFIRVEITKYGDLIDVGSERRAKDLGKVQLKGKDYVMEDGDICHFLFNV